MDPAILSRSRLATTRGRELVEPIEQLIESSVSPKLRGRVVVRQPAQRWAWLVAPLMLAAIFGGAALLFRAPSSLGGWVIGALVASAFLWVAAAIFFPARADRTCPRCGEPGLVRLDPETTRGLRCTRCDHEDREASAFLIAESEGPLEPAVLRDRARRSLSRAAGRGTPPPTSSGEESLR
jgi:hypothetical protein